MEFESERSGEGSEKGYSDNSYGVILGDGG